MAIDACLLSRNCASCGDLATFKAHSHLPTTLTTFLFATTFARRRAIAIVIPSKPFVVVVVVVIVLIPSSSFSPLLDVASYIPSG